MDIFELYSMIFPYRNSIYGALAHEQALHILFHMMERGHVDGIIKSLTSLPAKEITTFFNELSSSEKRRW